jgi:hypothetical protein
MDTGGGDKSNTDNDLYLPQTDSFWEVCIRNSTMKDRFFFILLIDR